ncbi:MAG TPA: transposase [Thermoanaerobaculia bacterium]|nr:transposase [Thermoanaerobaculia bacterium]
MTWHLFDALPSEVMARFRGERDAERANICRLRGSATFAEQRMLDAALIDACERFLDQHAGECLLRDRRAARIVAYSLKFFDSVRYRLYAWCVMPNHAHVVLSCMDGYNLSSVQHSIKGFTSKEINKLLGRSGTLWQAEGFDRCIRDSEELERTINYVLGNPIAAGLETWPFTGTNAAVIDAAL